MSVQPSKTNNDLSPLTKGETILLNTEISAAKNEATPTEEESLEENVVTRIELPEPDTDNITVLSHKLPNTPILPWNHYDSPWEEQENPNLETTADHSQETKATPEELAEEIEPDEVD